MLPSEKRLGVRRKHSPPDSVHTKCPRLDPTIKSKLPKQAKDTDANLVRIQARVLDAVNPHVNLLELARKGTLTPRDAAESAQQALRLLGNALATISMDRRQKARRFLNKELSTLVQEEDTFRDAAPCSLVKILTKKQKSILTGLVLCRDFLPLGKICLFLEGPPPTSWGGSNNKSFKQRKHEQNHAYNILCSKFMCCEEYRGYCIQRSKRVRGSSRAIYTRGVKTSQPKQRMQVSASVLTVAESPLRSSKVPELQPSPARNSLETHTLADPKPSIMGMPIIHLS